MTKYRGSVKFRYKGKWTEYGPSCDFKIGGYARLHGSFCNDNVPLNRGITLQGFTKADSYMVRFENMDDPEDKPIEYEFDYKLGGKTYLDAGLDVMTKYRGSVKFRYKGKWTEYGRVCEFSLGVGHTRINGAFCNENVALNGRLALQGFTQGERYIFKFENLDNPDKKPIEFEYDYRNEDKSYLDAGLDINTRYLGSVKFRHNGKWTKYGRVCEFSLGVGHTRINGAFCNENVALNGRLALQGFTQGERYIFKFENLDNPDKKPIEFEYDYRNEDKSYLDAGLDINTRYLGSVKFRHNGKWTKYGRTCQFKLGISGLRVYKGICRDNLDPNHQIILPGYSNTVRTLYRFNFYKNPDFSDVPKSGEYEYQYGLNMRTFSQMGLSTNTTYYVRLQYRYKKKWTEEGPACTFSLKGDNLKLANEYCSGNTLLKGNELIKINNVPANGNYRFNFYKTSNQSDVPLKVEYDYKNDKRTFESLGLQRGTKYYVTVQRLKGSFWTHQGPACQIELDKPKIVEIKLKDPHCDGYDVATNATVYSMEAEGAAFYSFKFEDLTSGGVETVISQDNELGLEELLTLKVAEGKQFKVWVTASNDQGLLLGKGPECILNIVPLKDLKTQPIPPVAKKVDAGFVTIGSDDILQFNYYEHYEVNIVDVEVFNNWHAPVYKGTLPVSAGSNDLELDVSKIKGPGFFTLQLTTSKNEKWFLRFRIP